MQVAEVVRGRQEGVKTGKVQKVEEALEEMQKVRQRVGRAKDLNGLKIELNLINKAIEDS